MWPAWQLREHGGVTSWFQVRLAFADGARVDALAVVSAGRVSIEDVQAEPALSLADLTALADWIEGPLFVACGVDAGGVDAGDGGACGADAGGVDAGGVDAGGADAGGVDAGCVFCEGWCAVCPIHFRDLFPAWVEVHVRVTR
ncbi:DUF6214 family protein, partial [Streptomyces sp. NPDC004658]|uniref:DUF6214 family protein n=1 Tax=Streptomyces sp. NPDC004658 TaxID=3154672 RepID=UPI0033BF1987